jgi:hypothetical protein
MTLPPGAPMTPLFLDRIEGDLAVLEHAGRELRLPVALLPAGAREGEVLQLLLTRDAAATQARSAATQARRTKLGKDDDGGDFKL